MDCSTCFARTGILSTRNMIPGALIPYVAVGKKTVAEFIEDADVSRLLRESGVDYGQGYYLGPPQPVEEVLLT